MDAQGAYHKAKSASPTVAEGLSAAANTADGGVAGMFRRELEHGSGKKQAHVPAPDKHSETPDHDLSEQSGRPGQEYWFAREGRNFL